MKRFYVVMMCAACKWKITDELKRQGYSDFDIDLNTNLLTFRNDVNTENVIRVVNNIGYKIEAVDNSTDELDINDSY